MQPLPLFRADLFFDYLRSQVFQINSRWIIICDPRIFTFRRFFHFIFLSQFNLCSNFPVKTKSVIRLFSKRLLKFQYALTDRSVWAYCFIGMRLLWAWIQVPDHHVEDQGLAKTDFKPFFKGRWLTASDPFRSGAEVDFQIFDHGLGEFSFGLGTGAQ